LRAWGTANRDNGRNEGKDYWVRGENTSPGVTPLAKKKISNERPESVKGGRMEKKTET